MASPRFPAVPSAKGHYESFYLKAAHPTDPLAVWIRYTVHKAPRETPTGSLWFTFFDGAAAEPVTAKVTFPGPRAGIDPWLTVGEASIGSNRARGIALETEWDLAYDGDRNELLHLPSAWMYSAPLPRTKLTSPLPEARFSGHVSLPGREFEVDGWPGMVGHNWGAEHAERWIWLHGWFADRTWLDVAIGRIKVGPLTTPWVANGMLSLDGERHRLGGLARARATKVEDGYMECRFELPGDVPVRGRVERVPQHTVVWPYADPGGGTHHSINASIASMSIDVEGRALRTSRGAAYELGVRETDHGLTVQPFEDG